MSKPNPCEGCIHVLETKSEQVIGHIDRVCTRFPPTAVPMASRSPVGDIQMQVMAVFPPLVAPCGEFDDGEDEFEPCDSRAAQKWNRENS